MSKNFDIIHGNPSQCLFAMVLPMMAAMFLNMAYNLVDSLWIGNLLGESAYAALTAATPILLLLNSLRPLGRGRHDEPEPSCLLHLF